MKAGFRKFAAALLAGTLALSACGPAPAPAPKEEAAVEEAAPAAEAEATAEEATTEAESDEYFKSWADDSKVVEQVKAYVEDVTNPDSENFIPVEDRIVTADFDGTLYGELDPIYFDWAIVIHRLLWDSTYTPTDDQVELAHIIEAIEQTRVFPDGLDVRHASTLVKSFEGMTVEEETEYAKEFAETPAKKFKNLVRKDAYYVPMRELVDYLEANDFKFYVVSGTDRVLLRSLVPFGFPELPASQIIGSPMQINASGQGEKDGLEYMWVPGDETVNVGELWYKNLKMNKVSTIANEIGQVPVIAMGNSSGDAAMLNYAVTNPKYKGLSLFVLCDDTERDWGELDKAESGAKLAEENGWITVSEKDDWKTIYGEGVEIDKDWVWTSEIDGPNAREVAFDEAEAETLDAAA